MITEMTRRWHELGSIVETVAEVQTDPMEVLDIREIRVNPWPTMFLARIQATDSR
jgi:hypothetical protein